MIIIKIIATLQCIVPEFYNPNEDDGKAELSELCVGELHVEYLEPAIHHLFKSDSIFCDAQVAANKHLWDERGEVDEKT